MPTAFVFRVHLAVPPAALASVVSMFVSLLGRDADSVGFSVKASPSGTGEPTMRLSSEVFTEDEVDVLRSIFNPGGSAHNLGARARRGFNAATETTTGEAGKTPVTVINEGEAIPAGVDWTDHRLSFDRFLEELAIARIDDVI